MRQKSLLLIALCYVPFCGCEEYEYKIRMEPDGDVMKRQIVCSGNVPDDVRARLRELYDSLRRGGHHLPRHTPGTLRCLFIQESLLDGV